MSKITLDRSKDGKDILVSVGLLAQFTGISERSFTNYKEKGIPHEQKGGRTLYPFADALKWLIINGYRKLDIPTDNIDREQLPPSVRKTLADAEIKEIQLQILKGELIQVSVAIENMVTIITRVRNRILSLGSRLAPFIAFKSDQDEVKGILEKATLEALEELDRFEDPATFR